MAKTCVRGEATLRWPSYCSYQDQSNCHSLTFDHKMTWHIKLSSVLRSYISWSANQNLTQLWAELPHCVTVFYSICGQNKLKTLLSSYHCDHIYDRWHQQKALDPTESLRPNESLASLDRVLYHRHLNFWLFISSFFFCGTWRDELGFNLKF